MYKTDPLLVNVVIHSPKGYYWLILTSKQLTSSRIEICDIALNPKDKWRNVRKNYICSSIKINRSVEDIKQDLFSKKICSHILAACSAISRLVRAHIPPCPTTTLKAVLYGNFSFSCGNWSDITKEEGIVDRPIDLLLLFSSHEMILQIQFKREGCPVNPILENELSQHFITSKTILRNIFNRYTSKI